MSRSMSDPQAPSDKQEPRRAEPLQPDKPGQGDEAEKGENAKARPDDSNSKTREQEQTALDNVREGYK